MSLWAIVPAKDPALSKTRLAAGLTAEVRQALSRSLFENVVTVLRRCPEVEHIVVVSRSTALLEHAERSGVTAVREAPVSAAGQSGSPLDSTLNAAIAQGAAEASERGATALLIVASDLPLIAPRPLGALVRSLNGEQGVAIAPDRHGAGTNVLLMRPPGLIPFAFGSGSFARHRHEAEVRGTRVTISEARELALDIDTLDDLVALRAYARAPSAERDIIVALQAHIANSEMRVEVSGCCL